MAVGSGGRGGSLQEEAFAALGGETIALSSEWLSQQDAVGSTSWHHAPIAGFWVWGNPDLRPTFPERAFSWEHVWGLASLVPPLLAWPKEHPRRPGSHQPGSMSPHASPTAFLHTRG